MRAVAYTYTYHRPIPINSKIQLSSSHFIIFQKNSTFKENQVKAQVNHPQFIFKNQSYSKQP